MNSNQETKNVLSNLIHSMDEKYLSVCKWVGTGSTVLGAVFTSCGYDPHNIIAFNLGSIFWLLAAIRMKDSALMSVNAGLLGIYAVGAVVRFF